MRTSRPPTATLPRYSSPAMTLAGDYDASSHAFVNGSYAGTGDISGIPGGCQPGSTWHAALQP